MFFDLLNRFEFTVTISASRRYMFKGFTSPCNDFGEVKLGSVALEHVQPQNVILRKPINSVSIDSTGYPRTYAYGRQGTENLAVYLERPR